MDLDWRIVYGIRPVSYTHLGVAWVAALLSALLSFERLFRDDFIDGSLEQLMLTAQPLALTALAKVVAHWLLTGLPLILLSPIAALLLSLEVNIWWALVVTLLVGTPILSCIGAIGVALTVGLRKGGVLLSLLDVYKRQQWMCLLLVVW